MGSERRIVNLAGGLGGTDAVNVNQLNAAIASVPSPASMPIRENNSSFLPTPAATGFGAIAVGSGSVAPGDLSVAFGQTSIAGGNSSTALGRNAVATADFTTAVGNGALASAAEASALGQGATASGVGSVALGQGAQALGANSVALGGGQGAIASGLGSVALGQGAQALASSSIALGTGSIASQTNTVSLGAPGAERRIVNLAPGVSATDAVNVAQFNTSLKGLAQRSYSGIAIAMAMGGIIMPEGKTYAVSANYGGYRGENGFAGGLALRLNDYSFVNGALGFGLEHGGVGGRAGVTVAW